MKRLTAVLALLLRRSRRRRACRARWSCTSCPTAADTRRSSVAGLRAGIRAFDAMFPEVRPRPPKLEELLPAPSEGELQREFGAPVRLALDEARQGRRRRRPDHGRGVRRRHEDCGWRSRRSSCACPAGVLRHGRHRRSAGHHVRGRSRTRTAIGCCSSSCRISGLPARPAGRADHDVRDRLRAGTDCSSGRSRVWRCASSSSSSSRCCGPTRRHGRATARPSSISISTR